MISMEMAELHRQYDAALLDLAKVRLHREDSQYIELTIHSIERRIVNRARLEWAMREGGAGRTLEMRAIR